MNYIYTMTGRQMPVFLCAEGGKPVRYVVDADAALVDVEVSYDPPAVRRKFWETVEGGLAGILYGPPTALRLNIRSLEGDVRLWVEQS